MADVVDDPRRARLASLLWNLKRAIQDAPEAVEDLGTFHFNAAMRDDAHRKAVIEKALNSTDPNIREIAKEISTLDIEGPIGPAIETPEPTPTPRASRSGSRWDGVALIGIVLAGGAFALIAARFLDIGKDIDVEGSLVGNTVWSAEHTYHLNGLVFVEGGATLTIESGTRVLGLPGSALIVTRDASLHARGTQDAPIVFTSAKLPGERAAGDWGGVVLLGNAPVNTPGAHIEGVVRDDARGAFGGANLEDNCGVMQYVRIEFAGHEISRDNELNGLTLGGCGRGTVLRYIQVHMGLDDGIEFFGGNANLSNVVISRPGDDGLDWDRGWQGLAQYVVIQQDSRAGDNGIEADNLKANNDAEPRSKPTLSNVTIVGSADPGIAQRGMTLRRGTAGDLRNMLVGGFTIGAVDIRDAATVEQIENGNLRFDGVVLTDARVLFEDEPTEKDDDGGFDEARYFRDNPGVITSSKHVLPKEAYDLNAPGFVPLFDHKVLTERAVPVPQGEFWDEAANFIGAFRPGSWTTWIDNWTAFPDD